MYVLPEDILGYAAGTELRDVPYHEAAAMECNRCGDCCDGLGDGVLKDEATGLPRFTWGSNAPDDLYTTRYGERLLIPVVMGDGGPQTGKDFEVDADGVPYTAFQCSQLQRREGTEQTACGLYGRDDPEDLRTLRPRNCGDFPIFGLATKAAIIDGKSFVPAVGSLPRCTWYGMRLVGPFKDESGWRERWETQQKGVTNGPELPD